jgi:hypothetical protein
MRSDSVPSNLYRHISPFVYLAIITSLLAAVLLRNVSNWDYPLSGEFLTSPFHSEILKYSLNVWDEHFGLGFSNLLNSPGDAQYAAAYSGVMWIVTNALNSLFQQWTGATYFSNQVFSIFLLGASIYWSVANFRSASRSEISSVSLSVAILIIVHATDFFMNWASSAAKFPAGHGLLLIAFIQYRRLSQLVFNRKDSNKSFIPLALSIATLLLVFNPYFLALVLLMGIQGVVEFAWANGKRKKVVIFYAQILAISIALMIFVYGYVWIPSILSSAKGMMSGIVGRHDTPMQYPLIDLLRFFNNSTPDHFSWFGTWLQFGLAIFGIILALFSPAMRRWARVDLFCIVIFVFFAKGSAPPFAEVNQWLHVNIPFLRLMGSGYPYFGVVYTLLVYYLVYGLVRAFDLYKEYEPYKGVYIAWLVLIVVTTVAVSRNNAYLSGDFGGRVQAIEYPSEYYEFKKVAEKEMKQGRAYYFPDMDARIGMDYIYSPFHPLRPMDCCYSLPFSSVFPVSIDWSNFNKYSGYYGQTMDFLIKHLDDGDELARVFTQSRTRYAVFDLSLKKSAEASNRMLALRDQVRTSGSFEFKLGLSNTYIEVYENLQWKPASTTASNLTLSSDDPNVFLDAAKNVSHGVNAPIVVSGAITLQQAKQLKDENLLKNVLLYNSDDLGLMLDLIRTQYELKPDANTLSSSGVSGWYTNNQVYQTQVTGNHGGRFIGRYSVATTANNSRTAYYSNILPATNYNLFIRAMVSPDSGRVLVHVNNQTKQLDLRSKGYVGLQWFELGGFSDATGKVNVEIESLDAGYFKRIDVISLVPNEVFVASSALLRNLFANLSIVRIEKPDYLEWKKLNQHDNFNITADQLYGDKVWLAPKKLMATRHNFMIHEDFDRFDEVAGQDVYNIFDLRDKIDTDRNHIFTDRNFLRNYGGENPGYNASGGADAGTYTLSYELVACQPFSELTLNLSTAFVNASRSIQIFVSDDAVSWVNTHSLISDENKLHDLGDFVRGKKKVFLRISYNKANKGAISILLTDLKIHGVAGREDMNCVNNQTEMRGEVPTDSSAQKNNGSYVALINKSYDNNWRMESISPFNIGYGFAAFPITGDESQINFKNDWEYKYRILLLISASVYLLLWIALFWDIYQRRSRRRINI